MSKRGVTGRRLPRREPEPVTAVLGGRQSGKTQAFINIARFTGAAIMTADNRRAHFLRARLQGLTGHAVEVLTATEGRSQLYSRNVRHRRRGPPGPREVPLLIDDLQDVVAQLLPGTRLLGYSDNPDRLMELGMILAPETEPAWKKSYAGQLPMAALEAAQSGDPDRISHVRGLLRDLGTPAHLMQAYDMLIYSWAGHWALSGNQQFSSYHAHRLREHAEARMRDESKE